MNPECIDSIDVFIVVASHIPDNLHQLNQLHFSDETILNVDASLLKHF